MLLEKKKCWISWILEAASRIIFSKIFSQRPKKCVLLIRNVTGLLNIFCNVTTKKTLQSKIKMIFLFHQGNERSRRKWMLPFQKDNICFYISRTPTFQRAMHDCFWQQYNSCLFKMFSSFQEILTMKNLIFKKSHRLTQHFLFQ